MKDKITKKPKRIKVKYNKHTYMTYIAEYNCPTCKATHVGFGPEKNVTRFTCVRCGQELIVI